MSVLMLWCGDTARPASRVLVYSLLTSQHINTFFLVDVYSREIFFFSFLTTLHYLFSSLFNSLLFWTFRLTKTWTAGKFLMLHLLW
jgi:hypothetical protein